MREREGWREREGRRERVCADEDERDTERDNYICERLNILMYVHQRIDNRRRRRGNPIRWEEKNPVWLVWRIL